jgi:L-serine/L-threonine ammonia-lyase
MVEKLRVSGANIIVHGSVWDEAHAEALRIAASTPGSHVVHPFDHPEIFEGHKTIIQELEGQLNTEPSAIMCSVGGGGLVVGIFRGLEDSSWKNTSVFAVETEGAESFGQCFKQQSWVKINSIDTIAKTLGALQVAEEAYKLSLQNTRVVTPITVTDAETVSAMGRFLNDHCFLVEPSCAANLATLYSDRVRQSVLEKLDKSKPLVIFVCGGSIVNTDLLSSLQSTFLKNES